MRKFGFIAASLGLLAMSAPVWAQPGGTYVSGILHESLGGAVLGTPEGRRLPVNNIGSSGQDGVEIHTFSSTGGSGGFELPFGQPAGSEIRIRPKGWDGTIKGKCIATSNGSDTVTSAVDFTLSGAIALRTRTFDSAGNLISDVVTDGPTSTDYLNYPTCPPPLVPTVWYWHGTYIWGCGYGLNDHGDPYLGGIMRSVEPIFPGGSPGLIDIASVVVTGKNLAEMVVLDASLETFGVDSWGLGQAHVVETFDPNDPNAPRLYVNNIGSSGQDGVAIDLGKDAGQSSLRSKKCPDCPPGHVTLIKFYDDDARLVQQASTMADGASGGEFFDVDFSGLTASDMDVEFLDSNGALLLRYPVGGLAFGGWMSGMCAPGCSEIWEQNWYSGTWTFVRCDCLSSFDFYTNTGIGVSGVHSVRFTPIGHDVPVVRNIVMTSDDTSRTMIIEDVAVTTKCPGDLTGDQAVTLGDLAIALANYGRTPASGPEGDLDGDGAVSLGDIAMMLSSYGHICP